MANMSESFGNSTTYPTAFLHFRFKRSDLLEPFLQLESVSVSDILRRATDLAQTMSSKEDVAVSAFKVTGRVELTMPDGASKIIEGVGFVADGGK